MTEYTLDDLLNKVSNGQKCARLLFATVYKLFFKDEEDKHRKKCPGADREAHKFESRYEIARYVERVIYND